MTESKTRHSQRVQCLKDWLDQLKKPKYITVIGKKRNKSIRARS